MDRPLPSRIDSLFLFLWIFLAAFIVYGTLIPFNWVSSAEAISNNISRICWNPFIDPDGSRASIPDILQNILLFVPVGFIGFIVLRPRNRQNLIPTAFTILVVSFLGSCLSLIVEVLQLLVTDRITSVTDLVTNSSGTAIGSVLAYAYFETLQKIFRSPVILELSHTRTFYPFVVSMVIVVVGALQPFDFTIDVGRIGSQVLRILKNPFDFTIVLRDEPFLFLRYILFGYVCSLWIEESGQEDALLKGMILSSVTAVFLEGVQIFTKSHTPGLQDTLVMVAGSVCGALFVQNIVKITPPPLVCTAVLVATFVTSGIQVLSPFQFKPNYQSMNFMPFLPYYGRNFITALGMFVEGILIYYPMGFILRMLIPKTTRHLIIIGLLGWGIASILEFAQGWVVGRYPDITDILGAIVGTLAGAWCAHSGWTLFDQIVGRDASPKHMVFLTGQHPNSMVQGQE